MIEKLLPLSIPAGIVTNGTLFQRAGRWAGGNLVRFGEDGSARAINGYTTLSTTIAAPGGHPRGAHAWVTGAFAWAACGTVSKLYVIKQLTAAPHTLTDITPSTAHFNPAQGSLHWMWTFDVLNGVLIAQPYSPGGGTPHSWDPNVGGAAVAIDTSGGTYNPHSGIVVTPENFLVVLQEGIDRQQTVKWASQGTINTWTPSSTNSAGSIDLVTSGELMAGRRVRGRTLLWTTSDLWALNYVGAPLYYGAEILSAGCGLVGPCAVAVAGSAAYWMSHRGFFKYDGGLQPLPCDIAEEIFPTLSVALRPRVWTSVVSEHNEIWWHWTTEGATSPNRVAIYNYVTGVWSRGDLARAAGTNGDVWAITPSADNRPRTVPLYFDANGVTIHEHEQTTAIAGAYLESGPISPDPTGGTRFSVGKLIGDNGNTGTPENVTIYMGTYPKVAENSYSVTIPAAGGETDVRISGYYVRYKQELVGLTSRIGTPRLGITYEGKR